MLEKVAAVVEKVIKVFDTSNMKAGDAYLMTIGDDGMEIFDDVLFAGDKVFILIEDFDEDIIKAAYIPRRTDKKYVQRFIITPDMDVTLEKVVE